MKRRKQILFPKYLKILEQMGENIKLARKRRKLTTVQVAERADIDRSTLYEVEKGNPSVSMGAYFNTLRVLGLQDDFLKLAADDEYGRKLQDIELINKTKWPIIKQIYWYMHIGLGCPNLHALESFRPTRQKEKKLLVLSMTLIG